MDFREPENIGKVQLSVIIPAFNQEAYLESCLSSLAGQDVEAAEFFVVDDGSIDASRDIITWHVEQDSRFM